MRLCYFSMRRFIFSNDSLRCASTRSDVAKGLREGFHVRERPRESSWHCTSHCYVTVVVFHEKSFFFHPPHLTFRVFYLRHSERSYGFVVKHLSSFHYLTQLCYRKRETYATERCAHIESDTSSRVEHSTKTETMFVV